MTMRELAKEANVSLSTVSKAFLDADDVSKQTKEHIFAVAKACGCFWKYYKGRYQKRVIAIICPELLSNFYIKFVEQLKTLVEEAGCIATISSDGFDMARQSELIEYYASYLKADGIFVIGLFEELKRGYDIPIVSLLSDVVTSVDSVSSELDSAIVEAVKMLGDLGHKKIAFISEGLTGAREEYYKNAMKTLHNSGVNIVKSNFRMEKAGEDGVRMLIEKGEPFSAVICAYDYIAFGAIRELKKRGIRVPEDVSVMGIDNISASEFSETALTTIGTNHTEICEIAWGIMKKKLNNKYFKSNQNIVLKYQLVMRESVAPVGGAK